MYTLHNYFTQRPPAHLLTTPFLKGGDELMEGMGEDAVAVYEADATTREAVDKFLRTLNEAAATPAAAPATPWQFGDRVRVRATGQEGKIANRFKTSKGSFIPGQANKATSVSYSYDVDFGGGQTNLYDADELLLVRPASESKAPKAAPAPAKKAPSRPKRLPATSDNAPAFAVGEWLYIEEGPNRGQTGRVLSSRDTGQQVLMSARLPFGAKVYAYSLQLERMGGTVEVEEGSLRSAPQAAPAAARYAKGDLVTVNERRGVVTEVISLTVQSITAGKAATASHHYKVHFDGSAQVQEFTESHLRPADAPKPRFKRGDAVGTPDGYGTVAAVRATDFVSSHGAAHFEYDVRMKGNGKGTVKTIESQLRPSDEIKINESRKPAKEKPAKAKKPGSASKPAKAKKAEPTAVVRIDEDVKVLRSYVRLHGRDVLVAKLDTMLRGIQRKIREELITKKSRYGAEVMGAQASLLKLCNTYQADESVQVEIGPADDLAKLVAIAGGEKVFPSLTVLKAFIGLEGKKADKDKLTRLLARLEKVKAGEDDPFRAHVATALLVVRDAVKTGKGQLMFTSQGLAGVSSLGGLLGAIDRHTRQLAKRGCGCQSHRSTSLSGCGCRA